MSRVSAPRQPVPQDVCVIYPSGRRGEPGYVAHSLRTDQVAVGDCVLDAYVELLLALRALYREAREDRSIQTECAAPNEVWQMLRHAKNLPAEIEEIAELRLAGRGPGRHVRHFRPRSPIQALPPLEKVFR